MATIPRNYVRLDGSERKPSQGARLLGPADEHETFMVTILVRRRPDGPPLPDYDYFLRTHPARRRRLSSDEFADKYGAAPDDLKKVSDFAAARGLTVLETHPARRTVVVSGTVTQMNHAFGVSLGRYEHEVVRRRGARPHTETYRGRDGFIHIPADLAQVIVGVFGLDNRRIGQRNSGDPPSTAPISTATVTSLYDFPTTPATGQTIGILSEAGYLASDINSTFGGSPPTITDINIDTGSNLGPIDFGETTQDICIAALAAPGAAIAVYFTPPTEQGWIDMIHRLVHPNVGDPVCSVMSSSFYVSDGDDLPTLANESISVAWLNAATSAFNDAAIQAVTVCIAAGDTGSNSKVGANPAAWGKPFAGDGKAHVQYPGSDPWVLCVGGTTIGDIAGSSFDEYVWNDPTSGDPSFWGTTGGGISDFFALPSYQSAAGVPVSINDGHAGRGVPDVAGNASLHSGYSGIVFGGASFVGNGTSASTPLWAGLIAVINAAFLENVGFVNPAIYALGSSVFRDIDPPPGPPNNSNGGIAGYPAGPGWDACTGWGSPRGKSLLAGLRRFYGRVIAVNEQDNLQFGTVCHGPAYRKLEVFNVGDQKLFISSISIIGPAAFTLLPNPSAPVAIAPGDHVDFTIEYNPTAHVGLQAATVRIVSDDPVTPVLDLPTSGSWGTGALETIIADHGDFGDVCLGSFVDRPLTLNNNGPCALKILHLSAVPADFETPNIASLPLVVAAGVSITLPIRFRPVSLGHKTGTITIVSDDPSSPHHVRVSGTADSPRLVLGIADHGNFGNVCVGSFKDEPLLLNNGGKCTLLVNAIASSSGDFLVPEILSYPIAVAAGASVSLPIRFQPASFGPTPPGTVITVDSNDPHGPKSIHVSGNAPHGKLVVTGSTFFGGVRACCREERVISVCNVGDCKLHVSSVALKRKNRHWKLINNPFPATLHPGSCLAVVIRYKATEKYPRACELVITSDDPTTPVKVLELLASTIWSDCGCRKCCDDCRKGCCEKRHCEPCCCEKCHDDCDDERGDDDDRDC
jgi:kumamolisin